MTGIDVVREVDATAAARALEAAAGSSRAAEGLAPLLLRDDVHLLVARVSGKAAGTVIGHELPRLLRAGKGMLLYSIDVAAAHRRRGIGCALIAALEGIAEERGCDALWLLTRASNEPAMRLYAAAGLRRPAEDDVVWEIALPRL